MIEVSYDKATIKFPETLKNQEEQGFPIFKGKNKLEGNNILMNRNGYYIQASVFPGYNIPIELSDNLVVQRKIVKPAVKRIVTDIETIDDILEELRELARVGRIQGEVYYEREPTLGTFKVYDYSRIYQRHDERKLFDILSGFKGIPDSVIVREYQRIVNIANFVNREEQKAPYVIGSSLREATTRALIIYKWEKDLRDLSFR